MEASLIAFPYWNRKVQDLLTTRGVTIAPEIVKATNFDQNLFFDVSADGTLQARMIFNQWAHLSIELFANNNLVTTKYLKISLEARSTSGTTELWSTLVGDHQAWLPPVKLGIIDQDWKNFVCNTNNAHSFTDAYRVLKLILRRDCELHIRNIQIHGIPGIESLHIIVPWYYHDVVRLQARKLELKRLSAQDIPFDLHILEVLYDGESSSFNTSTTNHHSILVNKDPRYRGIDHTMSLFQYFLNEHVVQPFSGYIFLNSDAYPSTKQWLRKIFERLSLAILEDQQLVLNPFLDIVNSKTDHHLSSDDLSESHNTQNSEPIQEMGWALSGRDLMVYGLKTQGHFCNNLTNLSTSIPKDSSNEGPWEIDFRISNPNYLQNDGKYTINNLLWQACIDHCVLTDTSPLAVDSDGFLFFKQHNSPSQICIRKSDLTSMDSVLAHVLRIFGAPMQQFQHITTSADSDSTLNNGNRREPYQCSRDENNFRIYALGVEKSCANVKHYESSIPEFINTPFLRDVVSDLATCPNILLTAPGVTVNPAVLPKIENELNTFDIVFSVNPTKGNKQSKPSLPETESSSQKAFENLEEPQVSIVAFTRLWWLENHLSIPHGLLFGGNFLNCIMQLVRNKWPEAPVLSDSYSFFPDRSPYNHRICEHNNRVSKGIQSLHKNKYLSFKSIKTSRRKIRISTKHAHLNSHTEMSTLSLLDSTNGVFFDPFINASFANLKDKRLPYTDKWCGILKGILDPPPLLSKAPISLPLVLENDNFQKSLSCCTGVFTYSHNLRKRLVENCMWDPNVPVEVLPHIVNNPTVGFRVDQFWRHRKLKLYSIGYTGMRLHSFFELVSGEFEKILSAPVREKCFRNYLEEESKVSGGTDSIQLSDYPSRSVFEKILSEYPVFFDFYDLSASNELTECIVRNTPVIIRRHPAAEELLGINYPLFFSDLNEASELLTEDRILAGHNYLGHIPKHQFSPAAFLNRLENSEIYKCL